MTDDAFPPSLPDCALVVGDKYLRGSLWEQGGCWVFLGGEWDDHTSAWGELRDLPRPLPALVVVDGFRFFERRGVVVVAKGFATMNSQAKDALTPRRRA